MISSDYRDILSVFIDEGVEYLVVGAYALAAHGLPRATGDIDLWVNATSENAGKVWLALKKFGAPLSQINSGDFEEPGIVYQIGVPPNRIDVLTSIDGVEFTDAWGRRYQVNIDELVVPVISREHLILNKKTAGRPQDLVDIAQLEAMDWS